MRVSIGQLLRPLRRCPIKAAEAIQRSIYGSAFYCAISERMVSSARSHTSLNTQQTSTFHSWSRHQTREISNSRPDGTIEIQRIKQLTWHCQETSLCKRTRVHRSWALHGCTAAWEMQSCPPFPSECTAWASPGMSHRTKAWTRSQS